MPRLMNLKLSLRVGGVPEHFNLPWHLAMESSAFADIGLDLDWTDYATGTGTMLADLAAARLDLAILLTEGAALGLARGLPIEAVSLYTTSPLIWGVHVPPRSPARTIADLRGARFAISREGSGSHLMSLALGIEHGWPLSELRYEVVNDLPGAIAAFRNGRADVFLWEHFTTEPVVAAGGFRRIDDFIGPWPAWTVCANATAWQQHRSAIESLITIVATEANRLATAPDAGATIAERYSLRSDAVREWLGKTRWVSEPTSPRSALRTATEMLRSAAAV
jgi:ABC-type nitrate/sulfonate/bicarbonate transport system substrate-binding protein